MIKGKIAIAFTENTNQSDEAIELMRNAINSIANKHNCTVINGNRTTLVFANTNETWLDDVIDEVKLLCDVTEFEIDFQSEEHIYKNFSDVAKEIGHTLIFKLLNAIEFDVESLDYKAIACRDLSRFYR